MRYKVALLIMAVGISVLGIIAAEYAVAVYWAVLAAYWSASIQQEWGAAIQRIAEGLKDEADTSDD